VSLDLHNLTDTRYLDIVGQPAPGRSVRLGVEVTGR
jgi:outer membrane receptor protein involved in Fe transport